MAGRRHGRTPRPAGPSYKKRAGRLRRDQSGVQGAFVHMELALTEIIRIVPSAPGAVLGLYAMLFLERLAPFCLQSVRAR
jgi:hypothetical protein